MPTARLDLIGCFDGFCADRRYFDSLSEANFVERDAAERDEARRQIIPYVVIRTPRGVLSYARTGAGRESRLHGLRSVGVGGHVNPEDLSGGLTALVAQPELALGEAARREVAEEVVGADDATLTWIGFIREEATAVARVHFGVVYEAELETVELSAEGKMTDARFSTWAELGAEAEAYEGWSQRVIRHMSA